MKEEILKLIKEIRRLFCYPGSEDAIVERKLSSDITENDLAKLWELLDELKQKIEAEFPE